MSGKRTLVYGVGINDANYKVTYKVSGKKTQCTFYKIWGGMLGRCHSDKVHTRFPSYVGCTVCDEWLVFSNFKRWMEQQDWQGKQLDKDLLVVGNKIYSPNTCVFISNSLNSFLLERSADRGDLPLGVTSRRKGLRFEARCHNPFDNSQEYLGYFLQPIEAHKVWQARKHEHALRLADLQTDPRVAQALRERYAPDKDWSDR